MGKLYLITGFLGAGKTTFLRHFIRLFAGRRVLLIVNEFGREGVDGALLADLGAGLCEIDGGSVFCACRVDQFAQVLDGPAARAAEVILVEASGLSDPTGVRKLFSQTGRFPHIDYQGAVCLVDAVRFPRLYATARACVRQLAASDAAVVNRTDLAGPEQLEATLSLIRGQRPDLPVVQTSFGRAGAELPALLAKARQAAAGEPLLTADLTLRKLLIRVSPAITPYALEKFLDMFLEVTFRVKGFVRTSEGLYFADCVGTAAALTPYAGSVPPEKQGFLIALSGAGMPLHARVREAAAWYPEHILSVE